MSTFAQRAATAAHRKRATARGLARVELQVPVSDAPLMRKIATKLRKNEASSAEFRKTLRASIDKARDNSVLNMFGSDLPDEYFEGVFDHVRDISKRKIDL